MTRPPSAHELIAALFDEATFTPWDTDVVSTDPLRFVDRIPYTQRLAEAERRSGVNEALVTGHARLGGRDVVVVAGEFGFLAGTMGVASAERLVRAFERATEARWPVVGLPISGGTRMQEGTAAFIQMASCAAAIRRFRDAGRLFVVYLRNPTTGGVLASWGSLGQLLWAAPGALIGMTGPRVAEQMTGEPFPAGVQVAEHLRDHGVVDDVVAPHDLRARLGQVVALADDRVAEWTPAVAPAVLDDDRAVDAWDAVQHSRRTDRPGLRELLGAAGARLSPLRGDGAGTDDAGCVVGLARVCGVSAVVIAHDRPAGQRGARLGSAGYRKALRGMALARELGLPLVSVVDTAGAAITPHDEETGLARAIADCLAALSGLPVPTVSVLLGEGAGGGALALLPADRVIAVEHSWLAPIAPEGASAILHRTTARAAELAAAKAVASTDLRRLGIVDTVVPDGDAEAPARVAAVVGDALRELLAADPGRRLAARARRYRSVARD